MIRTHKFKLFGFDRNVYKELCSTKAVKGFEVDIYFLHFK